MHHMGTNVQGSKYILAWSGVHSEIMHAQHNSVHHQHYCGMLRINKLAAML